MNKLRMVCLLLFTFLMSAVFTPISVFANEHGGAEQAFTLTYEQALRLALDNNLQLQDLHTEIRNAHIGVREEIWRMERDFFSGSSRSTIELSERAIDNALLRLYNRLRTDGYGSSRQNRERRQAVQELMRYMECLRIQKRQAELAVEITLRGAIVSLANINQTVIFMQQEIVYMETNVERLTLAFELGFISTYDLQMAVHALSQTHYGYSDLLRNQTSSRRELNYLLYLPFTQFTEVIIPRQRLGIADLNISAIIAQAPSIRYAQMEFDRALGARWAYTGNQQNIRITENERRRALNVTGTGNNIEYRDNTDSIFNLRNRIALQDAVDRAVIGREQAMRSMEATIYRGLADLDELFDMETSLQRDLTQAQSALTIATANFDLGRITQLDVDAARLAVSAIEQRIDAVCNSVWILVFMLENPT